MIKTDLKAKIAPTCYYQEVPNKMAVECKNLSFAKDTNRSLYIYMVVLITVKFINNAQRQNDIIYATKTISLCGSLRC